MKKLVLLIFGCMAITPAWSITFDYSNGHNTAIGLKLGMSSVPSLDFEIDGEYRPFRYLGANVGFIYTTSLENKTNKIGSNPSGDVLLWEIDGYKEASYRMAAKAGLQFTTPAIMLSKNEMGLSMRFSPGITIPIPTNKVVTINNYQLVYEGEDETIDNLQIKLISKEDYKNSGAKFCYWHARVELVLEYEEQWEFSLGYTYSNLDLYGGSRSIEVHGSPLVIGKKEPMHCFNLGMTFKF